MKNGESPAETTSHKQHQSNNITETGENPTPFIPHRNRTTSPSAVPHRNRMVPPPPSIPSRNRTVGLPLAIPHRNRTPLYTAPFRTIIAWFPHCFPFRTIIVRKAHPENNLGQTDLYAFPYIFHTISIHFPCNLLTVYPLSSGRRTW